MVASGLALLPALNGSHAKAPSDVPAKIMAGPRTVTYEIDHIGESYMKNADITNYQGNRTRTEGLNIWWTVRLSGYGEYVVHNSYPFVTAYALESQYTKATIDPGFGLTTMARMHIVAANLPTMGTAKGMDPIFVPVLNPASPGGGNVTIQWRSDVASDQEMIQLKAVTSTYFGRVYYGAPRIAVTDDGYWNLIYGHMTFDAAAAKTYLGLAGGADLVTEFNTANAGNAIGNLWLADWMGESAAGGKYDTEAAYEYANDIRQVVLKLDPASTPTLLKVRLWSLSWGNDAYLMRMFDASGLNTHLLSYFEDMYFNATIGVSSANVETSYYMQYAMLAWANPNTGVGAWNLESMHIDYVGTTAVAPTWVSRFNPYDPDVHPELTRLSLLPGTTHYGQQVNYYTSPAYWPLVTGEKITCKLPTRTFFGYDPYLGATDALSATKVTELNSHSYIGQAVLGASIPDLTPYYSAATKTITLTGPTTYVRNPNPQPGASALNYTGVPTFNIDVVRVTNYTLNLVQGWNMVSLPLVAGAYKASTLPGLVRGDTVTEWNVTTQSYKTYLVKISPLSMDFAIQPSTGYWIYAAAAKPIKVNGTLASALQTRNVVLPASGTGWVMVGLASLNPTLKASNLAAMYTPAGKITVVAMYDTVTKTYKTWLSAVPMMNNFAVNPGQGYWCYVSSSGSLSYVP
jgi:hypothetical protein